MSKVESVKVAVRVRPYNDREKDAGSKCIIRARVCGVAQVAPERGMAALCGERGELAGRAARRAAASRDFGTPLLVPS